MTRGRLFTEVHGALQRVVRGYVATAALLSAQCVLAACGGGRGMPHPDAAAADVVMQSPDGAQPMLDSGGDAGVVPAAPGRYSLTITADTAERHFLLFIPTGYNPATPIPLLFALHGGGGGMANMERERTDLIALAEERNYLLVFPNGQNDMGNLGSSTWKATTCCEPALTHGRSDVEFVRAMIAALSARITVDPRHIHVTGFSNGGGLTQLIAAEMADVVASVSTFGGPAGGWSGPGQPLVTIHPTGPVPVLMFQGMADQVVAIQGDDTDIPFADTIAIWVAADGCNPMGTRTTTMGGMGLVYTERYAGCVNGSEVIAVAMQNVGHGWATPDFAGIDGFRLSMDFFASHPRP